MTFPLPLALGLTMVLAGAITHGTLHIIMVDTILITVLVGAITVLGIRILVTLIMEVIMVDTMVVTMLMEVEV